MMYQFSYSGRFTVRLDFPEVRCFDFLAQQKINALPKGSCRLEWEANEYYNLELPTNVLRRL